MVATNSSPSMARKPDPLSYKHVRVTGVSTSTMKAMVKDQLGKEIEVSLTFVRTPFVPAVGDKWMIDKTLGVWTFAAKIVTKVSGPGSGVEVIDNEDGTFTIVD